MEMLEFLRVTPGMKVLDLGAGGGYTTELIARAVAPGGVVYMQNDPSWLPFLNDAIAERFAHPAMQGVARADVPFDAPVPAQAKDLDLAVMNVIYHDIANMPVDRAFMNKLIFDALRPGGVYVVIDSSAKDGTGFSETKTLHRIDESVVRDEVQKAGFRLDGEATSCAIRTTRATGTPRPARRRRRASGGPATASRSDSSSRTARNSEHLLDPGEQLGGAEWLLQPAHAGLLEERSAGRGARAAGDDQQPRGEARIQPRQLIADPDRVAVGKMQVGDDHVPALATREAVDAGVRGMVHSDLVRFRQGALHHQRHQGLVVDHQDPGHTIS